MKCDRCGIEIEKENSIETVQGENLCFGCDAERLTKSLKKGNLSYCENCYKEDLKNWVMDDVGLVFCDRDCFEQFYATDKECINTTTRRIVKQKPARQKKKKKMKYANYWKVKSIGGY